MEGVVRYLSTALFALTVVCFTLPFITVTTTSPEPQHITGFDMVAGTIQGEPSLPQPQSDENTPQSLVFVAMVIAVLGFLECLSVRYLFRFKYRLLIPASSAFAGVILLLIFILMVQKTGDAMQNIAVNYEYGLWLTLTLFAVAYLVNIYLIYKEVKRVKSLSG